MQSASYAQSAHRQMSRYVESSMHPAMLTGAEGDQLGGSAAWPRTNKRCTRRRARRTALLSFANGARIVVSCWTTRFSVPS